MLPCSNDNFVTKASLYKLIGEMQRHRLRWCTWTGSYLLSQTHS